MKKHQDINQPIRLEPEDTGVVNFDRVAMRKELLSRQPVPNSPSEIIHELTVKDAVEIMGRLRHRSGNTFDQCYLPYPTITRSRCSQTDKWIYHVAWAGRVQHDAPFNTIPEARNYAMRLCEIMGYEDIMYLMTEVTGQEWTITVPKSW